MIANGGGTGSASGFNMVNTSGHNLSPQHLTNTQNQRAESVMSKDQQQFYNQIGVSVTSNGGYLANGDTIIHHGVNGAYPMTEASRDEAYEMTMETKNGGKKRESVMKRTRSSKQILM